MVSLVAEVVKTFETLVYTKLSTSSATQLKAVIRSPTNKFDEEPKNKFGNGAICQYSKNMVVS